MAAVTHLLGSLLQYFCPITMLRRPIHKKVDLITTSVKPLVTIQPGRVIIQKIQSRPNFSQSNLSSTPSNRIRLYGLIIALTLWGPKVRLYKIEAYVVRILPSAGEEPCCQLSKPLRSKLWESLRCKLWKSLRCELARPAAGCLLAE